MASSSSSSFCFAVLLLCFGRVSCTDYMPDPLDSRSQHGKYAPACPSTDFQKEFRAYLTCFDIDEDQGFLEVPNWVAYEMRKKVSSEFESCKRPSPWITEKALYKHGEAPDDKSYAGSGYDRGHMCAKAHAQRVGEAACFNTHTMVNACPQTHEFNAGVWNQLEDESADLADLYGVVWVIAGPIFNEFPPSEKFIGDGNEVRVPVPDGFFKIVVREVDQRPAYASYMFDHFVDDWDPKATSGAKWQDRQNYNLTKYIVSLSEIEQRSEFLFSSLHGGIAVKDLRGNISNSSPHSEL